MEICLQSLSEKIVIYPIFATIGIENHEVEKHRFCNGLVYGAYGASARLHYSWIR